MKKYKEGDDLTLSDIHTFLQKSKKKRPINESNGIKPYLENGVFVFETDEDIEKYFGGTVSLEEAFK